MNKTELNFNSSPKYLRASKKISKDKIIFFLVSCYFFITPFGNVFRFSLQENSLSVGTIIVFLVVLLTFLKTMPMFFKKKIWFILFLLLFWLLFSSLYADDKTAYIMLFQLFIYVLFAMGLATINFTTDRLNRFFLVTISALLISSILTIVDFWGIMNIPYFNDFSYGGKILGGAKVMGASGPFGSRTGMASYYAILLILIVVYGFTVRNKYIQIFSLITVIIGIIALMISFNRAAPFAIIIATLIFIVQGINTVKSKAKVVLCLIFFAFFSIVVIQKYFPRQTKAISYKMQLTIGIGEYSENDLESQRESDALRGYLLKTALKKVFENPIGHGLTRIPINNGEFMRNPHGNITQIIWGTGFFGIFWIIILGVQCLKLFTIKLDYPFYIYHESIKYGLLGWGLVSMTHTNWATGIAWALIGIMIRLNQATPRAKARGIGPLA